VGIELEVIRQLVYKCVQRERSPHLQYSRDNGKTTKAFSQISSEVFMTKLTKPSMVRVRGDHLTVGQQPIAHFTAGHRAERCGRHADNQIKCFMETDVNVKVSDDVCTCRRSELTKIFTIV
jgi:hypothetical protein